MTEVTSSVYATPLITDLYSDGQKDIVVPSFVHHLEVNSIASPTAPGIEGIGYMGSYTLYPYIHLHGRGEWHSIPTDQRDNGMSPVQRSGPGVTLASGWQGVEECVTKFHSMR